MPLRQPLPVYGPPQSFHSSIGHQQSFPSFPKPIKGAGCDGWKPIPGPSFGAQSIGHSSGTASISAHQPENTYLPPQSNPLQVLQSTLSVQPESTYGVPQLNTNTVSDTVLPVQPENTYLPPSNALPVAELSVQPLPTNLQLPVAEATSFHNDVNLGSNIASGLGLTSINVVKSEGIEVCCILFTVRNN